MYILHHYNEENIRIELSVDLTLLQISLKSSAYITYNFINRIIYPKNQSCFSEISENAILLIKIYGYLPNLLLVFNQ